MQKIEKNTGRRQGGLTNSRAKQM